MQPNYETRRACSVTSRCYIITTDRRIVTARRGAVGLMIIREMRAFLVIRAEGGSIMPIAEIAISMVLSLHNARAGSSLQSVVRNGFVDPLDCGVHS